MNEPIENLVNRDREGILKGLALACFLIFFNAYMIAPLIPTLALEMRTTSQQMGFVIPAFLLPYGLSTLFYGPLSDRVGRKKVLIILLFIFIFTTLANSFAFSAKSFVIIRIITGLCAGGIAPISIALVGDIFPFKSLGRAMGWMFGAIAGGMSFGSTLGAWLNPYIGWRNEFVILAVANVVAFIFIKVKLNKIENRPDSDKNISEFFKGYVALLKNKRGRRTYSFIFINGIFHSGVFTWLGLYLKDRYALGDVEVGIALLGYGLPGMIFGPMLGKMADRYGRRTMIPVGFLMAAFCAYILIPQSNIWLFAIAVTILSLGFDLSHPLMAGIILSVDPKRRGQAMGFNTFTLFIGMGLGSLLFQALLNSGFILALIVFASIQLLMGVLGFKIFSAER